MVSFSDGNSDTMLNAGNITWLTGELLTVRDQSLRQLIAYFNHHKTIPVSLQDSYVFFASPTPGYVDGHSSIGPTTSWRMADYIPFLLEHGVKGFIGKGYIPLAAQDKIKRSKALYFQALGGAGAYYGARVHNIKPILFEELGPEAVFSIEVTDFPAIISIDTRGAIFS